MNLHFLLHFTMAIAVDSWMALLNIIWFSAQATRLDYRMAAFGDEIISTTLT